MCASAHGGACCHFTTQPRAAILFLPTVAIRHLLTFLSTSITLCQKQLPAVKEGIVHGGTL